MRPVVAELCAGADSEEGRARLAQFIREEFLPWLSGHVATMDTATAHFLSMQGVE
jgi:hemerythrin